jgi:hypothetical protein
MITKHNNSSFEKNDSTQINLAIIRDDTMVKRENNKNNQNIKNQKLVDGLLIMRDKLDLAAKFQPCPACKEDIKKLSESLYIKIKSLQKNSEVKKDEFKKLSDLDYINTLTDIAIVVSKLIKPFTKRLKPPALYKKVLEEDREGNAKVKELFLEAKKITEELIKIDKNDRYLSTLYEIIKGDIRAVDFKLNADPVAFYLFDKIIRLGYKTHLLEVTSKIIVRFKNLENRMGNS